jgi:hypothetical protein
MHPELLNGKPRCTIIETFDGRGIVAKPGFKEKFKNLNAAKAFIQEKDWQVNIHFIKGSPLFRVMKNRL